MTKKRKKKETLYCARCWQVTGLFVTGHADPVCASPTKMTEADILRKLTRYLPETSLR